MTKYCVKKPFTIFVAVIAVMVIGVVSLLRMQTDLLPDIKFLRGIIQNQFFWKPHCLYNRKHMVKIRHIGHKMRVAV